MIKTKNAPANARANFVYFVMSEVFTLEHCKNATHLL